MALINQEAKELHCKIVYYGPSLSGKTTNIRWVYQTTKTRKVKEKPSDMMEFKIENPERTYFFDFLPLNVGQIHGLNVRFHLYSVPGQVVYEASRRLLLKNLDAIIFVADSQRDRFDENTDTLKSLEKNIELIGYDIKKLPFVIQYNKRDLKNITSISELRSALNRHNSPDFSAQAEKGIGVMETLNTTSKLIISNLKNTSVAT